MSKSLEGNDLPPTAASQTPFVTLIAAPIHRTRLVWTASVGGAFVVIFGLIIRGSAIDVAVVQFLNGFHNGLIATVTDGIYNYFEPAPSIIGTVLLTAVILVVSRNLRIASTFAVVIAATWLSLAVVKLLVHRVRPDESLLTFPFTPTQVDASYPSGHTTFITALVVTLVLAVSVGYRRWLAGVLGGSVVAGVGIAVVVDGLHYPSDVIGSIVWAVTVAPLVSMLWVSLVIQPIDRLRFRSARPEQHAQ